MKQIELQILASDIRETSFINSTDCAITRALKRVGLPYEDAGISIQFEGTCEDVNINQDEHSKLSEKVRELYRRKGTKKPIEDFVHTITFYDLE